jgi:hypothetical protein
MRSLLIFILLISASSCIYAQEQAVIVHFFNYGSRDLTRLFALEDKLEKAIAISGAGEYDGNEIAVDGSDGYLYMYGPDADRLFLVVKPILELTPFTKGAHVTKRYGPPQSSTKETHVVINP